MEVMDETSEPVNDLAGKLFVVLLFGWIVIIGTAVQAIGWLAEQFAVATGTPWPSWGRPGVALGFAACMLLPALLLVRWRNPRYRVVFQLWSTTAVYALLLVPTRLAPPNAAFTANLLQIGLTLLVGIVVRQRFRRFGRIRPHSATPQSTSLAWLLAALTLFGWFIWGAPGSLADLVLNGVAALAFGWLAGMLLYHLFQELAATSDSTGWNMTLGGFVAGAVLLIMAGNFGFNGMQLVQIVMLPAAGWLLAALANRRAITTLVALAVAIPAIFVDPDELSLVLNLGSRDVAGWALIALAVSLGAIWLLGLLLFALRGRLAQAEAEWGWRLTAVSAWLLVGFIFIMVGQPGLYGDRLFVILRDQAAVDTISAATPDEQRTAVYTTLTDHANRTQADLRRTLDLFGVNYTPYYLVNALEVDGGPLLRLWLSRRSEVDRVIDSPVLRPLPEPAATAVGTAERPLTPQWNLTDIGADRVWAEFGVRGEGVVVGQSDSGADWTHPELRPTYRGAAGSHDYNWFDPWNHTSEPVDHGGHGTHTLGSVLGQSVGVAPAASWIACANLDRNLGNPALYLDCLQFMLAPFPLDGDPFASDPARGANVLNNSWGCPPLEGCDALSLQTAVDALRAAGVFVVASAGNDGAGGCETVSDPIAIYDSAFSVGAVDSDGALGSFSSRGPVTVDGSGRTKPDIVAPGVNVLSAFPQGSYEYADGTSMAGPHVAGVVALVWSANPSLIGRVAETEQILIETARPYDVARFGLPTCAASDTLPNNAVGYGLVDAYAAVARALGEAGGE